MNNRNNVEPSTLPCETLAFTDNWEEVPPSITTDCDLQDKKLAIQLYKHPEIPNDFNLTNKTLCQTLSKALLISRGTATTSLLASRVFCHFYERYDKTSTVERLFRKPY